MIEVIEFSTQPLFPGEQRPLVLDGDGPFRVAESCFVDNPPPKGFRPCTHCSIRTTPARKELLIEADTTFWKGKNGRLELEINDTVGDMLKLELRVIADRLESGPAMATA